MTEKHYLTCLAPICQDDRNLNFREEVVWCPGEAVCSKTPYQEFQRKQVEINKEVKKGTFRNIEEGYTLKDLETRSI